MAEPTEELEPLFDYTRVQPLDVVCLDDDDGSDCLIPVSSKRRKSSKSAVDKVQEAAKVINIDDSKDDDDLDWLAPPPKSKVAIGKEKPCENSMIKELRKTKQELISSFKDSPEDISRSVKRDLKTSINSAADETPIEKPSKQRTTIVISIQDKEVVKQFRVCTDDKFERLFKRYADETKLKVESLVFSFDGDKINPMTTPTSLDMENEDVIEVHVK